MTPRRRLPSSMLRTWPRTPSATPAAAGLDFKAIKGKLTFKPGGPKSQDVPVTIYNDKKDLGDKVFQFVLSSVSNATPAHPARRCWHHHRPDSSRFGSEGIPQPWWKLPQAIRSSAAPRRCWRISPRLLGQRPGERHCRWGRSWIRQSSGLPDKENRTSGSGRLFAESPGWPRWSIYSGPPEYCDAE